MDNFFQRYNYLIEHTSMEMTRPLMDDIDWSHRLIGIKGPRGVGKTTFLLQYAKKTYGATSGHCLYINMNSFYFQGRDLVNFAEEFVRRGGKVLIVDQIFKQNGWREELCECYHKFPYLRIIFATTTVEYPDAERHELSRIAKFYYLHGFSFREYINLQTQSNIEKISLDEVLHNTEDVQKSILMRVRPWNYLQSYLHHGYYPFYIEHNNFNENLLKSINNMLEVDVLFIKQTDVKYLNRLKKLLYLLSIDCDEAPNVSYLAKEIQTSRATVMNYMKNLEEARLIHQLYKAKSNAPKKPARIYIHNANLLYSTLNKIPSEQDLMETFFVNSLWRHNTVAIGKRPDVFVIDGEIQICVCDKDKRKRKDPGVIYTRYNAEIAKDGDIPIWMFGFLY
ncbi:MAG: AAA family ATPase [Prevotellaceae bacterium]|nr:AAA family ATPase [Candidatus Faecinaster equi]